MVELLEYLREQERFHKAQHNANMRGVDSVPLGNMFRYSAEIHGEQWHKFSRMIAELEQLINDQHHGVT